MTVHISCLVQSTLMKHGGIKPFVWTPNLPSDCYSKSQEEHEDTKDAIRIRKSKKDRQHNDLAVTVYKKM